MIRGRIPLGIVAGLALAFCPPGWADDAAQKAGDISALLPVANIVRGPAKQPAVVVAKKGDVVVWNDLIRTDKGGRARVTMLDQSILSVGSQSELRIVKHDPRSQQTALELNYGRVRAEVTPVTRSGGQFEIKTPTAVAGVIGTDFGMTSGLDATEFVCLSGAVSISNVDPNVPGTVSCYAGQTVTVIKGKPPSRPKPATSVQINSLVSDTAPAAMSSVLSVGAQGGEALPLPNVDRTELSVELGATPNFHGSASAATGGAAVAGYQWMLCGSSYHSAQLGVPLGANTPACPAIASYSSSSADFQIPTCSLPPGEYTARLNVIDTIGNRSAMDVLLTVNAPGYDDPTTQLRSLALAYSSLQPTQFMKFFDPANYPAYAMLQENVRTTLASLHSMNINLQPAQTEISCNQAVVRTTWTQKYSFSSDPAKTFNQTEGLTIRFNRTPGAGWLITDIQGDNGTLQGIPPGISATGMSGGLPPDQIAISSDRNNATTVGSSPSSPVQINGLLAETVNLQLTRATCSSGSSCPGSVDLSFSGDPALLDNVTGSSGNYVQHPVLSNVPYYAPAAVAFAAALDSSGQVSPKSAQAIVNVIAVTIPATGQPVQLSFNIGDIDILAPSCVYLPPAGSATHIVLQWVPVNGFNANTLNWQWAALPTGITVDHVQGAVSGSGNYSQLAFQFTNNNPADLGGTQFANFQVSIGNALGTAVKHWQIPLALSASVCGSIQKQGSASTRLRQAAAAQASRIRGSWEKDALSGVGAEARPVSLPDLQILAKGVSYTPSLPKPGDVVEVRFRVSNAGDADAVSVPIALRINGVVAVSETFDVAAGRGTLGALRWNTAQLPAAGGSASGAALAELVIDPGKTTQQKTPIAKSALLPHFALSGAPSQLGARRGRLTLELSDRACAGVRFNAGVSDCNSADAAISVEDLSTGQYTLSAPDGIADLGFLNSGSSLASAQVAARSMGSRVPAIGGHTYAVSLRDHKLGTLTLLSIRNPHQLSAKSGGVFHGDRQGPNRSATIRLGGQSGPPQTGDVAPLAPGDNRVYFELMYEAP